MRWRHGWAGGPAVKAARQIGGARGSEQEVAARFPDPAARDAEIMRIARVWAGEFDAHSLLVLGRAANAYDAAPLVNRIRARVLYVLSRTDALFPPSLAPDVM